MYDDEMLDAAVAAGAVDRAAVERLRAFAAARTGGATDPDNERFRLLTGFNDVFVTLACVLLLVAIGALAPGEAPARIVLGSGLVAATSWGLAEYFTRVRRMALPSIVLLLAFVGAVFAGVLSALASARGMSGDDAPWTIAVAAGVAAAAAWAHWRRFRVPITVAAGAGALVALAVSLAAQAIGADGDAVLALTLASGLAVFALAMRFDAGDTARITRRTDVAFWLHLLAAPLIVHPVFALAGFTRGEPSTLAAVGVVGVYLLLIAVALVIDRRALLVSALFYVLYAIQALLSAGGRVGEAFGLTALVIGSALVLLSAAWGPLRRALVARMPGAVRGAVPA